MTDEMMALRAMLEKGADADVLREMIGFVAERLMELEVQGLTGAGHGERSAEWLVQRNGYRDRDWDDGAEGPHRGRHRRVAHPQTAQGHLPSRLSGTAADG